MRPTLTIEKIETHNCAMAISISGVGQHVDVGSVDARDTLIGLHVQGENRLRVGSMEHRDRPNGQPR
jgi:hypothetical protein